MSALTVDVAAGAVVGPRRASEGRGRALWVFDAPDHGGSATRWRTKRGFAQDAPDHGGRTGHAGYPIF